ncbi:MAG: transposase [Isosphaeraceae bacterium]
MSRPPRASEGGLIYHALNRASARLAIFEGDDDFAAFERVLDEAITRYEMRLLSYCVMPNHFHLVVWPRGDGDLSRFMRWLTMTHAQRWHARRRSAGSGHLYQGRFRSFPVQDDAHLDLVSRYVESNPTRAGLTTRAEHWRWSGLRPRDAQGVAEGPTLGPWPFDRPEDWVDRVNTPLSPSEELGVRLAIQRGQPFGAPDWQVAIASRLGLGSTLRPRGRPRKRPETDP